MKLKAIKHLKYSGAFYAPNDEFEANETWGNILQRIGLAEPVAEDATEKSLKPAKAANRKGGYNRRDMTKTDTK